VSLLGIRHTDMVQTIKLIGRVPSKKNSRQIFCRGKFPVNIPSKDYTQWHTDASRQLTSRPAAPMESAGIIITLFGDTRRAADLTNKAESIMDLLVDNGFIKDGNWFILDKVFLRFGGVDKVGGAIINLFESEKQFYDAIQSGFKERAEASSNTEVGEKAR
jgi:hypothetical protein